MSDPVIGPNQSQQISKWRIAAEAAAVATATAVAVVCIGLIAAYFGAPIGLETIVVSAVGSGAIAGGVWAWRRKRNNAPPLKLTPAEREFAREVADSVRLGATRDSAYLHAHAIQPARVTLSEAAQDAIDDLADDDDERIDPKDVEATLRQALADNVEPTNPRVKILADFVRSVEERSQEAAIKEVVEALEDEYAAFDDDASVDLD